MFSLELDFFCGLLGAILFRIRSEQAHYQNWIFAFVIGLFFSQVLVIYWDETVGQMIWVISAIGLGIAYFLRFNRKVRKTTIDFLKLACIALLIIYPITFYTMFPLKGDWGIVRSLTLPYVVTIYFYDTWVLKEENMKKKFIIVLIAQTVLILSLFSFSLIQKAEADEQRDLAVQLAKMAQEERFKAEKMRMQLDSLKENSN